MDDDIQNYMRRASNYQDYLFTNFKYNALASPYTACTLDTTATTGLCFSLTVDNCDFQDFGSHKGAETFNYPMFVDPGLGLQHYGTVFDLSGFKGNVEITNSRFDDNVLKYSTCDVAADILAGSDLSFEDLYPSWGDAKSEVQIRAVVSITDHYHQVILADNEFNRNSGTKGVVYLDLHDRTDHPLIVHGNTFDNNGGYVDASALNVRLRAASSTPWSTDVDGTFVETDIFCANTVIEDNTFSNNYGCQYEVGAALKV